MCEFYNTLKTLGERLIYHCDTSTVFLIILFHHLGTEQNNCCSFAHGVICPSLLDARLPTAHQLVVSVVWFSSSWCTMTVDRLLKHALCVYEATLLQHIQKAWHCPDEISTNFPVKRCWLDARCRWISFLCHLVLRNNLFEVIDSSLTKFGTKFWATICLCLQTLSLWRMLLSYSSMRHSPVTN